MSGISALVKETPEISSAMRGCKEKSAGCKL